MMQWLYDDDMMTFDQSSRGQTWHSRAFVFQRMSRRQWHVFSPPKGMFPSIGPVFSPLYFGFKKSIECTTGWISWGCSCRWRDSCAISRFNSLLPDYIANGQWEHPNSHVIFTVAKLKHVQIQSKHLHTKLTSLVWHSAVESHLKPSIYLLPGSGATNPSWRKTPAP